MTGIGYGGKGVGIKNTDAEMRDAVVNDATKFAGANLAVEVIEHYWGGNIGLWTEVDIAANRIQFDYAIGMYRTVDLDDDEDVYMYMATAANVNDFILDFSFNVQGGTSANVEVGIGLADELGTMNDVANGLFASIRRNVVNDSEVTIRHMTGGVILESTHIGALNDGTNYYGRLIRRSQLCWLGIFTDVDRTIHTAESPQRYLDIAPTEFTHLYALSGSDTGGAGETADVNFYKGLKFLSSGDINKYLSWGNTP